MTENQSRMEGRVEALENKVAQIFRLIQENEVKFEERMQNQFKRIEELIHGDARREVRLIQENEVKFEEKMLNQFKRIEELIRGDARREGKSPISENEHHALDSPIVGDNIPHRRRGDSSRNGAGNIWFYSSKTEKEKLNAMNGGDADMTEADATALPFAPLLEVSSGSDPNDVWNLLAMARQLVDQCGEEVVSQALTRAQELYMNKIQASSATDEFASLFAEFAIEQYPNSGLNFSSFENNSSTGLDTQLKIFCIGIQYVSNEWKMFDEMSLSCVEIMPSFSKKIFIFDPGGCLISKLKCYTFCCSFLSKKRRCKDTLEGSFVMAAAVTTTFSSASVWYAPEDPTLPKPWKGLVDGKIGYPSFWNPETNIIQYEKPVTSFNASSVPSNQSLVSFVQKAPSDCNLYEEEDIYYEGSNESLANVAFGPRANQVEKNRSDYSLNDLGVTKNVAHGLYASKCAEIGWSTEAYHHCHEITVIGGNAPQPFTSFQATGFPSEILREMQQVGFPAPTPIQAQSWTVILQGHDIVDIAWTEPGKTLGHLIPGFINLKQKHNNLRLCPTILVLSLTREWGIQTHEGFGGGFLIYSNGVELFFNQGHYVAPQSVACNIVSFQFHSCCSNNEEGDVLLHHPTAILDRRMVKRNNGSVAKVVIKGAHLDADEPLATWEDYEKIIAQFPHL